MEDNSFGRQIDCLRCRKSFIATWTPEPPPKSLDVSGTVNENEKKFREEVIGIIAKITDGINSIIPVILSASKNHQNESNTRLILDKIFQDILGYGIGDIEAEHSIKSKKADYVLSVNGQPVLVVEAKRVGTDLKEQHLFQLSSYSAHIGIR